MMSLKFKSLYLIYLGIFWNRQNQLRELNTKYTYKEQLQLRIRLKSGVQVEIFNQTKMFIYISPSACSSGMQMIFVLSNDPARLIIIEKFGNGKH